MIATQNAAVSCKADYAASVRLIMPSALWGGVAQGAAKRPLGEVRA